VRSKANRTEAGQSDPVNPEELVLLQQMCSNEWGTYPKPVQIGTQGQDWIIRFKNHANDKKPSTFVLGEYRKLELLGAGHDLQGNYFLPDNLSANEIVEHIRRRSGQEPVGTEERPGFKQGEQPTKFNSPWEELRALAAIPFEAQYRMALERDWPEPLSESPRSDVIHKYRAKLSQSASAIRFGDNDVILVSVEGAGKTTAHLPILADEALDTAIDRQDDIERFSGFAFRSREQARQRAAEFRRLGYDVSEIRSFRDHYSEACRHLNETEIPREEFEDISPAAVLKKIHNQQLKVYERLEATRRALWGDGACDGGSTIIVTTHKTLQTWNTSVLTRTWYHPDFDPTKPDYIPPKNLIMANFVVDDSEVDDLIDIMPEALYALITGHQVKLPNWKHLSRARQIESFKSLKNDIGGLVPDFERYNDLMRTDLGTYDCFTVDYTKIPFGFDNRDQGIYKNQHGKRFYVGVRDWIVQCRTRLTFLTTEQVVADVIGQSYLVRRTKERERNVEKYSRQVPFLLTLTKVRPIYPLKVPMEIDNRANAQNLEELCREIVQADDDALVVADGVHDRAENVVTFQSMKGLNGFTDKNIYVVIGYLAPAKYAELNILGQWLEKNDIIQCYYQDQLHQAVGRNRGFRLSKEKETKTVVICSRRMWSSVVSKLQGRVHLYEFNAMEAA
jgi:hypothetical protein